MADKRQVVMMVISQLKFGQYLKKPVYSAAAKLLPQITDLPTDMQEGDFDVLIIHKDLGLITGEVKSVGSNFHEIPGMTQKDKDAAVTKKVQEGVRQLKKAKAVLMHISSDMGQEVNITGILFLPYITTAQLESALKRNHSAWEVRPSKSCIGFRWVRTFFFEKYIFLHRH